MSLTRFIVLTCLTVASLLAAQVTVAAESKKEKQTAQALSTVKQSIAERKARLARLQKNTQALQDALKRDDLAIAKLSKAIAQTKRSLKTTTHELSELAEQKQTLTVKKQQQERQLAKQIRSAYSTGQYDYLKLLLNQEDSAQVQRNLSYFQYLNQARIKQINQFEQTISRLLEVTQAHQEKSAELAALQSSQQSQQSSLQENKAKRQSTIAKLNKQITSDQDKIAQLEQQEAQLVAALKELERLAKQSVNLAGLKHLKGKLSWPVKGRKVNRYGSRKQGYLTWKGAMFSAPVGRQVHSIHNGKVLFADWLKGYGLVTVIDHGQGYMSLYGHNQTLLKKVGDRVETGEPIALVGQSGGQAQSGLYFEIRHQGKAVNPRQWCR